MCGGRVKGPLSASRWLFGSQQVNKSTIRTKKLTAKGQGLMAFGGYEVLGIRVDEQPSGRLLVDSLTC